jgi:hypothetical protein
VRRDGRPVTEAAADRIFTTPEILAQEVRLLALAERRLAAGGADHAVEEEQELTPAQAQLASAAAGERAPGARLSAPPAPARPPPCAPAVAQLDAEGPPRVRRRLPRPHAAEVLTGRDRGVAADTLDKLLVEHRLDRPPGPRYDLPAGATVLVDESAMVSTPRMAELFELAERRAWRLVLLGDPMQFSAVGRSGIFGHLVETFDAIELDRVHRFTHAWEARASLRLRRGDVGAVDDYEGRGRLHGGTERRMRDAAVDAWWQARQRGETASLTAPTNAAVIALNTAAQRRRLKAGDLDAAGPTVEAGPHRLHIGDTVTTRHNDRHLVTDRGFMVKNRDRWTLAAVHADGAVTVDGRNGRVRLPGAYLAEHIQLAYAETSHASQGRTVDRSFLYLDGPTTAAGVYVPLTRGRDSNEAFVVLQGEDTPADVIAESLARTWVDRPAIAVQAEMADRPKHRDDHRIAVLDRTELRGLLDRAAELDQQLQRAPASLAISERRQTELAEERQRLERSVVAQEAQLQAARATLAVHDRPLHRRRHHDEVEAARRQVRVTPAAIEQDQTRLAEVTGAEDHVAQQLAATRADLARAPAIRAERSELQRRIARDADARAALLSTAPSGRIAERLGPRPDTAAAARLWSDAAGRLAQHHAAFDLSRSNLLGSRPRSYDDAYAVSQRAAAEALDRLDRALGRQPKVEPPHRSLGLAR